MTASWKCRDLIATSLCLGLVSVCSPNALAEEINVECDRGIVVAVEVDFGVDQRERILEQALENDVTAQYALGSNRLRNRATEEDGLEGLYWMSRAARNGCFLAQMTLVTAFRDGGVVRQDVEQALWWLHHAQLQEATLLESFFFELDGVEEAPRSTTAATPEMISWYREQAMSGNHWAAWRMSALEPENIITWVELSASGENPLALIFLGMLRDRRAQIDGEEFELNFQQARSFYDRAMNSGSLEAWRYAWRYSAENYLYEAQDSNSLTDAERQELVSVGLDHLVHCAEMFVGCAATLVEVYDNGFLHIQPDCDQASHWQSVANDHWSENPRSIGGLRITTTASRDQLHSCLAQE